MINVSAFRSAIPGGRTGVADYVPGVARKLLDNAERGHLTADVTDNEAVLSLYNPVKAIHYSLFAPDSTVGIPLSVTRTTIDPSGQSSIKTIKDLGERYNDNGLVVARSHIVPFYGEFKGGLHYAGDIHSNVVEGGIPGLRNHPPKIYRETGIALDEAPIGYTFSAALDDQHQPALAEQLYPLAEKMAGVSQNRLVIANPFVELPGHYR